jgi:hypothetical protein
VSQWRAIVDFQLERTAGDRRLYAIDGVGTLRLTGLFSGGATAEANGRRWRFERTGLWRRAAEAADDTGAVVGEFEPRSIRRGGTLSWAGRELELRPASAWRERYALADGERELATFDGKSWGKRPVALTVDDRERLDPALLLFTAFVVRGLAEDADAVAATTASTAATSGGS